MTTNDMTTMRDRTKFAKAGDGSVEGDCTSTLLVIPVVWNSGYAIHNQARSPGTARFSPFFL